ncbi:MAG: beta-lactamase family protein [Candidatus Aminicenantes bacterium]|nr:beta-lactamase family protein [Candidatus Aminicenantes bacterium]
MKSGKVIRSWAAIPAVTAVLFAAAGCGDTSPAVARKIKAVEKGLMSSVHLQGLPSEKFDLSERMAFYRIPAVSIAVIDQKEIVWARAYGERDNQVHQPASNETLFQGGAFSQVVASAVVYALAEQGRVSLDEDAGEGLSSWIFPPEFEPKERHLDLRSLLAHGAGLSDQILPGYAHDVQLPSLPQVLDGTKPAANGPLWVPPAAAPVRTRYSEAGYVVLETFLTDRTGEPFDRLARDRVFHPAGMRDSTFSVPLPDELRAKAASGHLREGRPVSGLWKRYPEKAAKSLWTTPSEYALFLLDLLRSAENGAGKILPPEAARSMLGRQLESFGPGFLVEGRDDDIQFLSRGKTHGFACAFVLYPVRGQGAVIMTNSDNGFTLIDEILCALSAAYEWPGYKPVAKQVLRLDSETYKSFTGRYEAGPNYYLDVTWEDYYLVIQPTGQAATRFYAEGQTLFYSTDPYIRIQFIRDKGPVESLVLWQQDFELRARKIG